MTIPNFHACDFDGDRRREQEREQLRQDEQAVRRREQAGSAYFQRSYNEHVSTQNMQSEGRGRTSIRGISSDYVIIDEAGEYHQVTMRQDEYDRLVPNYQENLNKLIQ